MNIKKNYIYSMSYEILIMILPFITAPYISRVFGTEGTGVYAYTYSIATYFVMFARLGIMNYGNKIIAETKNDKEKLNRTFSSLYYMQAFLALVILIIYLIYIMVAIDNNKIIFIIQGIYVLTAIFDINWLYFGLEQFKLTVTRNSIIRILTVVLVLLFVKERSDLWIYTLIMCSGTLISELILWKFIGRYVKFVKVSFREVKNHFKPLIVLFIPVIALSIFKTMDKIMLGKITDMNEVGLYQNSQQLLGFPQGIITALGTVMLPRMCSLVAEGSYNKRNVYMEKSMTFVSFLSCAIAFGIAGISPEFVPMFFGNEFSECSKYVIYLSPTVILISWSYTIRAQYLIPMSLEKVYIKSTMWAAILNFTINLVLISKIGILGAIISTLIAEGFLAVYQSVKIRKKLDIYKYFKKNLFFLLLGIIMYFVIRIIGSIMGSSILTIVLEITLGGLLYIILATMYLYLIREEIIVDGLIKISKLLKKYANRGNLYENRINKE